MTSARAILDRMNAEPSKRSARAVLSRLSQPEAPLSDRGYRQPPAADATALGPGHDQYNDINDTRLFPGLTEAVVPSIPRLPVKGNTLEQTQAVLNNAALGVRDLVKMPLQMIEDPVKIIPGMVEMTGKALKTVYGLTPVHMGGAVDPRVSAEARRTVGEEPLETAMGLALPFGIAKGAVRGKPSARAILEKTEKSKPRVAEQPVVPQEATAKLKETIVSPETLKETPLNYNKEVPGGLQEKAQEVAEVAPEIQRNRDVSPPPPPDLKPSTTDLKTEAIPEPAPEAAETGTPRLAERTLTDAVEAKLAKDYGDLPSYEKMNKREQADRATGIIKADYEQAKRMAMGAEAPPEGLRPASIYEAVKIEALRRGEGETLRRLAFESTVPMRLVELGQEISAAGLDTMLDPVRAMQDIAKVRAERGQRIGKTADAAEIARLRTELETAQKALAERVAKKTAASYGTRNRIVTRETYEASRKAIAEMAGTLYANPIDPAAFAHITKIGTYHLEAGARVFADWSVKMAEDLGDRIKPHLNDIWGRINDDKRVRTYLKTQKTRLTRETEKFGRKLESLDLAKEEKRQIGLDPEATKLKRLRDQAKRNYDAALTAAKVVTKEEAKGIVELSTAMEKARETMDAGGDRFAYGASRVVYENFIDNLKNGMPVAEAMRQRVGQFKTTWQTNKPGAVGDALTDAARGLANTSVSTVASLDNSFPGKQGLKVLMTHPTVWLRGTGKSYADIAKTLGGKNAHDILMADVYSRPNYIDGTYQKAGILPKVEEQFPTSLPGRIPYAGRVFTAAEHAFTGNAIRMRTGLFDLWQNIAKGNGVEITDAWIRDHGKIASSMTGRGKWGKTGEPAVVRLVLWAPRLLKGNLDVLTMHNLGIGLETTAGRKRAAVNLLKIASETAAVMAIANALKPGSAETDFRSSDAGKLKFGNTRVDITGGAASIITLATRIIRNSSKSTTNGKVYPYGTGFGQSSSLDALVKFLVNKTNPPAHVVADWLRGEDFKGDSISIGKSAYGAAVPITAQNAVDLYKNPSVEQLVGLILDAHGFSSSTYEPKPPKAKK